MVFYFSLWVLSHGCLEAKAPVMEWKLIEFFGKYYKRKLIDLKNNYCKQHYSLIIYN